MNTPVSAVVTTTSSNVATTSVKIIGTNPNRIGFMLYNNSANSCYVNFNRAAASSSCSIIIPTFANFVWTCPDICFIGEMYAIRNAGSGTIVVTEFQL